MARSYIDPQLVALATKSAAPPWDWNPGATFMEAFNEAQRNRREQEKMELDMELSRILMPYKKAKAALELDKLQQDVERSTLLTNQMRQAGKTTHQNLMNGMRDPAPSRYGGGVAKLVQDYQSGALKPSGGTKILGQGYTGNE